MNNEQADRQISQMVEFIRQEAKEKAEELHVKTEQEFGIQRLELIENAKLSIREEYALKAQNKLSEIVIQKSNLLNHSRLSLVQQRNTASLQVKEDTLSKLSLASSLPGYPRLLLALVVQGLVKLQEELVMVRCREEDIPVLEGLLEEIVEVFGDVMQRDTGITMGIRLLVDREEYLPSNGLGGVVLIGANGRIVVDNSLDCRLELAYGELLPVLRGRLFPGL